MEMPYFSEKLDSLIRHIPLMEYTHIRWEVDKGVGILTLSRPEKLNALNHQVFVEIDHVLGSLESDPAIGGMIITGSGEKAFAAGADIKELSTQDPMGGRAFSRFGQAVFSRIENAAKPVIAAVNGFALGGGCELAMACHFRLASPHAKFGQPEVQLGILPGYGGTQRLPRLIGFGRAAELLLTGAMISAEEAARIGLINRVVAEGSVLDAARDVMNTILAKGPIAVRLTLEALRATLQQSLDQGLEQEALLFGLCCGTEDFREGTRAFLEKRPPEFRGR